MVSPKAAKAEGDKFGLHPVCAGPYKFVERVQQDRIVCEKFADYWNKDNVHIDRVVFSADRRCHGAAGQSEIRRSRPDRAGARHRHQGRARRPKPQALDGSLELGYQGMTLNIGKRQAQGPAQPVGKGTPGPRSLRSTARRINQVVFNGEFMPGNQWVSPEHPYYQKAFPVRRRDLAKAKALLKEAGVTLPRQLSISWCRRARKPRRSPR